MVYQTTQDHQVIRGQLLDNKTMKDQLITEQLLDPSSNKLTTPVIIGIIVGSIALLALIKYLYDHYKSSSTNTQQ